MKTLKGVSVPQSLEELWSILDAEPRAALMAGGTDLLVSMRAGRTNPTCIVCLERIAEIRGVRDHGDSLWIGAGETHAALLSNPLVWEHLPLLAESLRVLGSPLIRNAGTIGGNICTASPAGDALPSLYVLGADLELASSSGTHLVAIADFIGGAGVTALKCGEILKGIWLRKTGPSLHSFEKVGRRRAMTIAIVSLAALLRLSPDGVVEQARLAWGSVGPMVMSSPEAEGALLGRPLSAATLEKAAKWARKAVRPIDDTMASAHYRRNVAGNLLLRLERKARGRDETAQHGLCAS